LQTFTPAHLWSNWINGGHESPAPSGSAPHRRLLPAVAVAASAGIVVVAVGGSLDTVNSAGPNAPNVVVVMTDDQDTASLSVMKNVRRELVDRGVTFANSFVTTPECCPSRSTFLTGQYSHNHGVLSNEPAYGFQALDGSNTLPVWLRAAGYQTAYFGKYVNGYGVPADSDAGREVPQGWGEWHGLVGQTAFRMYRYVLNENGALHRYGRGPGNYQTDALGRKADSYLSRAPRDRPVFMVLAPLAPHQEGPLESWARVTRDPRPAPRDRGTFARRHPPKPPSFDERNVGDKPAVVRRRIEVTRRTVESPALVAYYRGRLESLLAVDRMVGRLIETLRRTGRLENTVVIFTSDNGFLLGQHGLTGKSLPYEESVRVPLVIRGPGFPAGRTRPAPVANIDLAPTISDLAGVLPGLEMDGISLLPVARGARPLRGRAIGLELLDKSKRYTGIRTRRFVLIQYLKRGDWELYDLKRDPYERRNAYGQPRYAPVVSRLKARLRVLRTCAGAACRRP
jgi:arylsulfatase A-like enzyme